jgi:hypothetical protein
MSRLDAHKNQKVLNNLQCVRKLILQVCANRIVLDAPLVSKNTGPSQHSLGCFTHFCCFSSFGAGIYVIT